MIYFIVNPNSKSGYGKKVWDSVSEKLNALISDAAYEAFITTKPMDATRITKELCRTKKDAFTIVPIGGDGTLSEVVNGLDLNRDDITLGYIPTGSGNDFCRSMHMPTDYMTALEHIVLKDHVTCVDIGEVSCDYDSLEEALIGGANEEDDTLMSTNTDNHYIRNRRFLVSCGCGYDAKVCHVLLVSKVKDLMNKLHLGKLCYITVGIAQIIKLRPFSSSVVFGQGTRRQVSDIAFCSMQIQPYEGGGFMFAPSADCSDGLLEVCLARAKTSFRFFEVLLASIFKKHVKFKGVSIVRTKKWSMMLPKGVRAHADGESLGAPGYMVATVHEKALKVII